MCIVATPSALKFMELPTLVELTGHVVRYDYKQPEEPDVLPPADAMVVAPATFNTVNKWASGISDTRSLSTSLRQVSREIAEAPPLGRWAC